MNEVEEWINEHGSIITVATRPYSIGEPISVAESLMKRDSARKLEQPFVVVREATEQEYEAQCRELLRRSGSKRKYSDYPKPVFFYFYEIRTD